MPSCRVMSHGGRVAPLQSTCNCVSLRETARRTALVCFVLVLYRDGIRNKALLEVNDNCSVASARAARRENWWSPPVHATSPRPRPAGRAHRAPARSGGGGQDATIVYSSKRPHQSFSHGLIMRRTHMRIYAQRPPGRCTRSERSRRRQEHAGGPAAVAALLPFICADGAIVKLLEYRSFCVWHAVCCYSE